MRVDAFANVYSLNLLRHPQVSGPPAAAPVEQLLITMGVNEVDAAVIVQPPQYGADHSYLLAALDMYPEKIRAVCAVGSPAIDHAGVIGARIDPLALRERPEAAQQALDSGKALYLSAPADLDGLGGGRFFLEVSRAIVTAARLGAILAAAADPRTSVLVIGNAPPRPDFLASLAGLTRALGPERLAWGSGFPHSGASEGYAAAVAGLRDLAGGKPFFNPADPAQELQ